MESEEFRIRFAKHKERRIKELHKRMNKSYYIVRDTMAEYGVKHSQFFNG